MSSQFKKGRKDDQTLVAGYDRTFRFIVKTYNHTTEKYEATDIAGGTFTMYVYDEYDEEKGFTSEVLALQKTGVITDAPNGIIKVTYADIDTVVGDVGTYWYKLDYLDISGLLYSPVWGKLIINV